MNILACIVLRILGLAFIAIGLLSVAHPVNALVHGLGGLVLIAVARGVRDGSFYY